MASGVLSYHKLNTAKKVVSDYLATEAESKKWDSSMRLMEVRTEAEEQRVILDKCLAKVKKAIKLEIKEEDYTKLVNYFSEKFAKPIKNLNALQEAFEAHQEAWKRVDITAREQKMRVLVTHALLRLSEKSGVETGALFIGTMVGLGFVYMFFFYQAAAGQYVHTYWTLEDLFIQAIHVAWFVVPMIFVIEFLFRILLRGYEREKKLRSYLFKFFLRTPKFLLITILIFLLLLSSKVGYESGKDKFDQLNEMVESKSVLELATVTEGTVLRNVYLVGTTATTAVFLQLPSMGQPPDDCEPLISETPNYSEIWKRFSDSFFFTKLITSSQDNAQNKGKCRDPEPGTDRSPPQDNAQNEVKYRVIVMDRGLVVCHAKGKICENLPKLESKVENNIEDRLTDLNIELDATRQQIGKINTTIGTVNKNMNNQFNDVETHMNRHYYQITAQLSRIENPDRTVKAVTVEQVDKGD